MKDYKSIKPLTENLDVLYVEDDEIIVETVRVMLSRLFRTVDVAYNGREGLEKYAQKKYDIIISDIRMPKIDGIEMTRAIKTENPKQRIVITSASDDSEYLLELIDIGIEKFILKPLTKTKLLSTLEQVSSAIMDQKMLEEYKRRIEEINAYTTKEQIKGHTKQKSIIVNQLENDPRFRITTVYLASDILSGDFYSLHKKKDGSLFMYLLDAMGHGISPSLTSFSIANAVKNFIEDNDSFETFAKHLTSVLKTTLVEDEQLSCLFIEIGNDLNTYQYFSAGMYPAYVSDTKGLHKLKSNNPPFMNFDKCIKIRKESINGFKSFFAYTDGLCELEHHAIKQDEIQKLLDYETLSQHIETLKKSENKDDITLIYLEQMDDLRTEQHSAPLVPCQA